MRFAVIGVLASAAAVAWPRAGWLESIEDIYYDYEHVLAGVRYMPTHVAVVTWTTTRWTALKDDPLAFWAPHFGRAMDVLSDAGVKAVGLDFLYQVSAEAWLKKLNLPGERAQPHLRLAVARRTGARRQGADHHLVQLNNGELTLLLPPADHTVLLPHGANDLGIDNLPPDSDKYVRHFFPALGSRSFDTGRGLCHGAGHTRRGPRPGAEGMDHRRRTNSPAPRSSSPSATPAAGTVPTVSMKALLEPGAESNPKVQALRGKVMCSRPATPAARTATSRPTRAAAMPTRWTAVKSTPTSSRPFSPAAIPGHCPPGAARCTCWPWSRTRGDYWRPIGFTLHVQNGAILGAAYTRLQPSLPRAGGRPWPAGRPHRARRRLAVDRGVRPLPPCPRGAAEARDQLSSLRPGDDPPRSVWDRPRAPRGRAQRPQRLAR